MKLYQPLVLQKLHIRVADFHVRQFALHKHLPETTAVQPHRHRFSQFLLYLSGRGRQKIGSQLFNIETGSLVFIPAEMEHAFHREANRRPICLAMDFDWPGASLPDCRVISLSSTALRDARHLISAIAHIQQRPSDGASLRLGTAILNLLEQMLQAIGLVEARPIQLSPLYRKIEGLLNSPESESKRLSTLAQKSGYQHDYLNRLLRAEAGMTLGQLRARVLMNRAQKLLATSSVISEVSDTLGFNDPNYFSRWFKKQTGVTPKVWKKHPILPSQKQSAIKALRASSESLRRRPVGQGDL